MRPPLLHRTDDIMVTMVKLCECGCGKPAPIATQTSRHWGWTKGQPKRFLKGHCIRLATHTINANPGLRYKSDNVTHGCSDTLEFRRFMAAKTRCTNPRQNRWYRYGGRGIKFLYEGFEQFLADVGLCPSPKHTLDRINNDDHYRPGNCRWATQQEQSANREQRFHWKHELVSEQIGN